MKCYFDISIQRILRECITQTSLDVQAMRSAGGDNVALADSVYDDFTMNEDNKPEVLTPLQNAGSKLCLATKDKLCHYNFQMDVITHIYDMTYTVPAICGVVQDALLRYYKYNLLAWWYLLRNAELAQVYSAMADDAIGDIISGIGLNKARLVGHYF